MGIMCAQHISNSVQMWNWVSCAHSSMVLCVCVCICLPAHSTPNVRTIFRWCIKSKSNLTTEIATVYVCVVCILFYSFIHRAELLFVFVFFFYLLLCQFPMLHSLIFIFRWKFALKSVLLSENSSIGEQEKRVIWENCSSHISNGDVLSSLSGKRENSVKCIL